MPTDDLVSDLIDRIRQTIHFSEQVLIHRENFDELSQFLNGIIPFLEDLIENRSDYGGDLDSVIEALGREVNLAKSLVLDCSKRNRIFLLISSRRISQQLESSVKEIACTLISLPISDELQDLSRKMVAFEFQTSAIQDSILSEIEVGIRERNFHRSYANNVAYLIAEAIGISKDRAVLKRELDEFKNEIADRKQKKEFFDAIQMDQIVAILERADVMLSFEEKKAKYYGKRRYLGNQILEPLQSFYCPITREIMEDPVETLSGQTFERSAIEKWIADGNAACPLTMSPLSCKALRPNVVLRNSIEEWKERNTIITIASIRSKVGSSSEEEVVKLLDRIWELCKEKELNRECVVLENYLPVLVGLLGRSNLMIRNRVLAILFILAINNDDVKELIVDVDNAIESIVRSLARRSEERKLAVALLLELSKNDMVRDNIGKVQGCILLLVTIANSDNNKAASDARDLLDGLSFQDENVVQMAKANYFKPLLQRLSSGSETMKKIMVTTLADMDLTDHSKAIIFRDGGLKPLLYLLSQSDPDMKAMAVEALQNLSSLHQNGLQMIRERAIVPLLGLLRFQASSSSILQEQVAATIMNIALSAATVEANESSVLLESDDDISWLFSLIILTGPNIQGSILRTFYALCQLPSAKDMKSKLRQFSAIRILIPQCEQSDLVVRANAVKLLSCLTEDEDDSMAAKHLGNRFMETLLLIIRTSNDEEEIAAAMSIISNLPKDHAQITNWLLNAEVLPTIVRFLTDPGHNESSKNVIIENSVRALCRLTLSTYPESQKRAAKANVIPLLVQLLGSGTALTKRYAAISLAQFSMSSLSLSRPIESQRGFLCCSPPPDVGCPLHLGVCLVETSFCLREADAVRPLVRLLREEDPRVCEAALRAVSTLIEGEMLPRGSKVISEAKGIGLIIRLLSSQDTHMLDKGLRVLERIFRLEEYKKMHGASAQMALVDIAQRATGTVRALAARILAHLDVLHDQSSYF